MADIVEMMDRAEKAYLTAMRVDDLPLECFFVETDDDDDATSLPLVAETPLSKGTMFNAVG